MKILHVEGDTFAIDTGMLLIPFYKINKNDIIMLDSGWKRGEKEGILNLLDRENFNVKAIIISHSHIDHIGNASVIKKKYNSIIAMTSIEAEIVSSNISLKVFYGDYSLSKVTDHFGHMVTDTDLRISPSDNSLSLFGVTFDIIHTPGHSPGHIVIKTPDNVAYLGDALISYEIMEGFKMPYAFILKHDIESKLKLYHLNAKKYILAHKGIHIDIKDLITDNIYFYKNRADMILEVIEGLMTFEDILKAATKKLEIQIKTVEKYMVIKRMLRSYIEYLIETNKIEVVMDHGFMKYTRL